MYVSTSFIYALLKPANVIDVEDEKKNAEIFDIE